MTSWRKAVVLRTLWPCPCVYMSHQLLLTDRSHCRGLKKKEKEKQHFHLGHKIAFGRAASFASVAHNSTVKKDQFPTK